MGRTPAAHAPLLPDCAGAGQWVSLGRCDHDSTSTACPATREPSRQRLTAGPCWLATLHAVVQGEAVDGRGRPVTFENPRRPTTRPPAPSTTSRKWSSGSARKAQNMQTSTRVCMPTRTKVRREGLQEAAKVRGPPSGIGPALG